jgi:hypothetical protein
MSKNQAIVKFDATKKEQNLRTTFGRPAWHGDQRDRNYAIAWSLIHFLLQQSSGMYALRDVIQQAEKNFCKPFSAAEALNQAYPEGIERLEKDWRQWLLNACTEKSSV